MRSYNFGFSFLLYPLIQNTIKIAEIKSQNDQLECQKIEEKARIYENKLFAAEQKREKELQKKIEKVQKLVRVVPPTESDNLPYCLSSTWQQLHISIRKRILILDCFPFFQERRAELVRQNKAQAQDLDGQQSAIASSG